MEKPIIDSSTYTLNDCLGIGRCVPRARAGRSKDMCLCESITLNCNRWWCVNCVELLLLSKLCADWRSLLSKCCKHELSSNSIEILAVSSRPAMKMSLWREIAINRPFHSHSHSLLYSTSVCSRGWFRLWAQFCSRLFGSRKTVWHHLPVHLFENECWIFGFVASIHSIVDNLGQKIRIGRIAYMIYTVCTLRTFVECRSTGFGLGWISSHPNWIACASSLLYRFCIRLSIKFSCWK